MKHLIIILFLNIIFPQTSSLSLYGFGEAITSFDAGGTSLGESRLFSNNNIVLSSPSTYHNNQQASLAMTMSFNGLSTKYINKLSSNNFNHVSFGFPITNNQYFMLGIKPVLRSMIHLNESEYTFLGADVSHIDTDGDGISDPVKYKSSYDFSGGISEFSASISSKITDKVSLGFKVGKLFGTFIRKDTLNFYTVDFDIDGEEIGSTWFGGEPRQNKFNYSSYAYSIDGRFKFSSNNILAFYYGESDQLKVDTNYDNFDSVEYLINGYNEYGLGLKSYIYDSFGYIIEFQNYNTFDCSNIVDIFNKPSLDMQSTHYGIFYKNNEIKRTNINSIDYNLGFYNRTYSPNDYSSSLNDIGFTMGIGLEYLSKDSFNISMQFGKRFSEFDEFSNEKYYKLTFSIISNNDWFVKERE